MARTSGQEQHRREVSRIEGFSDAVFAFAVTLLVVSLEVPRTFNELELNERQTLDARVNIIDNAGIALIGVLSIAIATFGGARAAAAVAGPIYFLIGPFKWWLGWYRGAADKRLA